jgi:hypothetical protein
MTNQRRRYDSAADAAELARIESRAQRLDRIKRWVAAERRKLTDQRRHVTDRMRRRAERVAAQAERRDAA